MNSNTRETMFGHTIARLFDGLRHYADLHRAAYESPIGEDYVLGEYWKQMASGLLGLLNGETGTLDCGTWDRNIRRLAKENGFTAEEIDNL
jgi:hypothetical protein